METRTDGGRQGRGNIVEMNNARDLATVNKVLYFLTKRKKYSGSESPIGERVPGYL